MARQENWRSRYAISKASNIPLFSESVADWSPTKVELVSWLEFYHGIYSMPEDDRPNDMVIEDDSALEHFFKLKKAQREEEQRKARLAANKSGKRGGSKGKEFSSEGFRFI